MNVITSHILTVVTFTPAVGALLLLSYNKEHVRSIRAFALIITILTFIFSLHLIAHFDSTTPDFQFGIKVPWMPAYGIDYSMGVDGISVFLILLTTLLSPLSILASWSVHERLKEYFVFMLLLETGMIGVFASLDFFLFYVFWEVMLIPMYFLIGVWGGERRVYAAMKFVLYTMIGSVLMLVAIIALYFIHGNATGTFTFSYPQIQSALASGRLVLSPKNELWLFLAFFLAFAIKVPLFPFHTWLPDAHVEAPTAGSVLLAGVLLKMGTYGLVRFSLPLFPHISVLFAPLISALAIIGIIYGALAAVGVILSAVYMLWMYQRVVWGEVTNDRNKTLMDLAGRERVMLIPLLILMVWMGVYSNYFLRPMDASVMKLMNQMQNRQVEY